MPYKTINETHPSLIYLILEDNSLDGSNILHYGKQLTNDLMLDTGIITFDSFPVSVFGIVKEYKMKYVLGLIFIILFYSCNDKSNNIKMHKDVKFDSLIKEIKDKYPNYSTNDFVKEKANKYLDNKIATEFFSFGYLDEINYEVFSINSNPNVKGGVIQLIPNVEKQFGKYLHLLKYEIICVASDSLTTTIDKNKKYLIKGKPLMRLDQNQIKVIVNTTYYSPKTHIDYQGYYNLGVFLYDLESVIPID
jgi:hypothetical protein